MVFGQLFNEYFFHSYAGMQTDGLQSIVFFFHSHSGNGENLDRCEILFGLLRVLPILIWEMGIMRCVR